MKSVKLITEALLQPFNFNELRWRVHRSGYKNQAWAILVPYIDKTAIENRLDDVFGLNGWEIEFNHLPGHVTANWEDPKVSWEQKKINKDANFVPAQVMVQRVSNAGFVCNLRLKFGQEWVSKQGSANCTDIEAIKGGASNSFKRCAAKLGIGRYLYGMGESWANFGQKGDAYPNQVKISGTDYYWSPPNIDVAFLPKSYNDKQIENWLEASESREDMLYIWPRITKEQRTAYGNAMKTKAEELGAA